MILPIYVYGSAVLKRKTAEIEEGYPGLPELLENMWETMYNAKGVGLAAPQVGYSIRLFLVDTVQLNKENDEDNKGIKQVFINPIVMEETGNTWTYEEGCLSIPAIHGDVDRQETIVIEYYDEDFNLHTKTFDGMDARVIQHEYDHLEGILFTEKLKPVKRNLIKRKLEQMKKGKATADYPLRIPNKK